MKKRYIVLGVLLGICLAVVGWLYFSAESIGTPPPLFKAIKNNDIEQVRKLLDEGADINQVWGPIESEIPLNVAISVGNADIVKLLIDKGAKVFSPEDYIFNPLDYAIRIAVGDSYTISSAYTEQYYQEVIRENQKKIIPLLVAENALSREYLKIVPAIIMNDFNTVKQLAAETKEKIGSEPSWGRNAIEKAIQFSGNAQIMDYVSRNILR